MKPLDELDELDMIIWDGFIEYWNQKYNKGLKNE